MTKIEGPNALEKGGCANELGADLLSQMFDSFFIIIIEFWGITIDSIFWSVKTLSNFYVLGIYKAGEFLFAQSFGIPFRASRYITGLNQTSE